ncbi:hypothetical protein BH23PLA1_BH23PLA1_17580 [soil metagenome]
MHSTLPRPIHPLRALALASIYWLVLLALTSPVRHSGNMWSRYMTIESIVERSTLVVSRSPMLPISGTPDLARFDRRLYSDKPPVLSALGALVYAPLYWSGWQFLGSPREFERINLVLVSALVGLSSALAIYWLRMLAQVIDFRPWVSDLLVLGSGFGSLLFCYGVTFNNHSVAAGLLTAAFALILLEDTASSARRLGWRRGLAGLLAALAATIDLPSGGIMGIGLGIWLGMRSRWAILPYLAGSAGPILLHCGLQSLVTGSPLPVEMYPEALAYDGSYWASKDGAPPEVARWRFGLEFLFGPQGWLTVTPALTFAPIGLALALGRGPGPLRAGALTVLIAIGALLVYYVFGVRRVDFAGQSYGTRHLLAITPLAFFLTLIALERLRSRLVGLIFAVSLAVSTVYAWKGMEQPWSRIEHREDRTLEVLQRFVIYPHTSYDR